METHSLSEIFYRGMDKGIVEYLHDRYGAMTSMMLQSQFLGELVAPMKGAAQSDAISLDIYRESCQ